MNNLVVIGSGIHGALTALYVEMLYSHKVKDYKVVYVNDGEAYSEITRISPPVILTLNQLGISVTDLVRIADATFFNGTKYTNFSGGGEYDSFMNSYQPTQNIGVRSMHDENQLFAYRGAFGQALATGESTDKSDLVARASKLKRVGFTKNAGGFADEQTGDPFMLFNPLIEYGLNVKSKPTEEILLEVARSRGVEVLEGSISAYEENEEQDVSKVVLDSGKSINSYFIVDVSGYGYTTWNDIFTDIEWIDLSKNLPADSSIEFSMSGSKKIPAYTEITAMDYGYIWIAPLQNEYKGGYVYDSDFINSEEAKLEVEKTLGRKVEVSLEGSVEYGYVSSPLKNNILLAGNSANVLENKEATDLWLLFVQLEILFTRPEFVNAKSNKWEQHYSKMSSSVIEGTASLLNFIYFGRGEYNEFWSKFNKLTATNVLQSLIEIMDWRTIDSRDISKIDSLFSLESYYYVGMGIKYRPLVESMKKSIQDNIYLISSKDDYDLLKAQQAEVAARSLMDHRALIEELGGSSWT